MSYEIPQPLQHQEQIMFGLTAKQLFYAAAGIFPSLVLVKVTSLYISIPLSILMLSISTVFMFFDGEKWVKAGYKHLRLKSSSFSDKQFKKLLVIKEVNDGIASIEGNQKQRVALLMVTSLNFGIKPDTDKEIILLQFQRFLNALDFPIQIVMTTKQLSLHSYVKQHKKSPVYTEQQEIHTAHLQQLTTATDLHNRFFYIAIPEVNKALEIQVTLVMDMLRGMGLKVRKMETKEAIRLFQHYFQS